MAFRATVSTPLPNLTPANNRAWIASGTSTHMVEAQATVISQPRLFLAKSVSGATASPGDTLLYRVTYANAGTDTAAAMVLRDSAPASTTYIPNSVVVNGLPGTDAADGDSVTVSAGQITVTIGRVPVGGTAHLVVEAMIRRGMLESDVFHEREWWRYEVDGDPELAAAWILLPEDHSYTNFNLVQYNYEEDESVTIIQPTRMSVIRHGTILNWAVVHPDPGMTYSCRWKPGL